LEIREPVREIAQRRIVHGAVQLLAIARDEGYGVARGDEIDDVFYLRFALAEFAGEYADDAFH